MNMDSAQIYYTNANKHTFSISIFKEIRNISILVYGVLLRMGRPVSGDGGWGGGQGKPDSARLDTLPCPGDCGDCPRLPRAWSRTFFRDCTVSSTASVPCKCCQRWPPLKV